MMYLWNTTCGLGIELSSLRRLCYLFLTIIPWGRYPHFTDVMGDSLASWSPYSSLGSNIFFLDSCNTYISIIQTVFCNALDCERSMLFYLLIDECKANGHQLYNFTSKLKDWKERKTSFIKLITSQYTLMLQVI